MNKISFIDKLSIGFMIFSMTFGAGNAIYPLLTGYNYPEQWLAGASGFLISSALMSLVGFFAIMTYSGSYVRMISDSTSRWIGHGVTIISMLLLGPSGCIPRCSILAAETIKYQSVLFHFLFILTCLFFAQKKNSLIRILGKITGPLTILCLVGMIFASIINHPESNQFIALENSTAPSVNMLTVFFKGLFNGSLTFDLLAMIFYSRVIYQITANKVESEDKRLIFQTLISAGLLAMSTLAILYGGMIFAAAKYAVVLPKALTGPQLFAEYAKVILGGQFMFVQSIIILLACFSTTIALLTVFADFVNTISGYRISYNQALVVSGVASFIFANYSFGAITSIMSSLVMICYPILIGISLKNFITNIVK